MKAIIIIIILLSLISCAEMPTSYTYKVRELQRSVKYIITSCDRYDVGDTIPVTRGDRIDAHDIDAKLCVIIKKWTGSGDNAKEYVKDSMNIRTDTLTRKEDKND